MNVYVKWLLIGFIIGIGFYSGEQVSDHIYKNFVYTKDIPYEELQDISKISFEEERLIFEGTSYKIVGFITNNSNENYYNVAIESLVYDKDGLADVCETDYIRLRPGKHPFEVHCTFRKTEYPDAYIQSTRVKRALREKRT